MTVTITPSRLAGAITPPPSKSQAHRVLIAAALAGKGSVLRNLARSQDIEATQRCMDVLRQTREELPLLDYRTGAANGAAPEALLRSL